MLATLQQAHLERIVDLHCRVLYWSINSRLGKDHIFDLYQTMLADPQAFGFAYLVKNELVGFITATTDNAHTKKLLYSRYTVKKYLTLLKLSCLDIMTFVDLIENKLLIPSVVKKSGTKAEIVTWITDQENFLSPMAAVKCMDAALGYLRGKNIHRVICQVAKYDEKPNKYYVNSAVPLLRSFVRNNIYLMNTDSQPWRRRQPRQSP